MTQVEISADDHLLIKRTVDLFISFNDSDIVQILDVICVTAVNWFKGAKRFRCVVDL